MKLATIDQLRTEKERLVEVSNKSKSDKQLYFAECDVDRVETALSFLYKRQQLREMKEWTL